MFLITDINTDSVIDWSEKETYGPEGYPMVEEKNLAFPYWIVKTYTVDEIPEEVVPYKWCYTEEQGFFLDPSFEEPNNSHGISNELYNTIRDEAVAQIESEVITNADE
jgi:hypothetical protein